MAKASLKDMAREVKKQKMTSTAKKPTPKAPTPASFKSTEFVKDSGEDDEDSDEESESDSESDSEEAPAKSIATAPKANGKTAAVSPSSSESDEESSEAGSAEEDSSEEDTSEDTSEEDEDESTTTAPEKAQRTRQTAKPTPSKTVSFKNASPFVPPKGFTSTTMKDEDALRASKMFKSSNLDGKQIWYITAPASVPLTSIEEMTLKAVKKGTPVVSYNENKYGFTEAEDKGNTKILIPNTSDDGYRTEITAIDRTLHLQQIVDLPSIFGDISKQATAPAKKPIRQQPKGLKMRFTPIGFGGGQAGRIGTPESELDVDMEEPQSKFRKIAGSDDESDIEMQDAPAAPAKTSKSDKSTKSIKKTSEKSSKRKHKEVGNAGENKSSSISSFADDKQLKRQKTKQTKSEEARADRPSVSTEPRQISSPILPSAVTKTSKITPILPPKYSKTAEAPKAPGPTINPFASSSDLHSNRFVQSHPSKHITSQTQMQEQHHQPLKDTIRDVMSDSSLSEKEAKKIRKLKKSIPQKSNSSEPGTNVTPIPPPPSRNSSEHRMSVTPIPPPPGRNSSEHRMSVTPIPPPPSRTTAHDNLPPSTSRGSVEDASSASKSNRKKEKKKDDGQQRLKESSTPRYSTSAIPPPKPLFKH